MGEDPGPGSTQVTNDQRPPEEIRQDIGGTREELGDTVEALAGKADVKAQAKAKVEETKQTVAAKKDELLGKARSASPEGATSAAAQLSQKARENPVAVRIAGAFVAGFVAGRLTSR